MVLVRQRTQLKNRIHATLAKYGLRPPGFSDMFGVGGRQALAQLLPQLPAQTAEVTESKSVSPRSSTTTTTLSCCAHCPEWVPFSPW
jgi:hypothetical protein